MISVTVKAIVGEDRQLTLELPEDVPTGPVEVTITSTKPKGSPAGTELTREQLRALLAADGLLDTGRYAPPDAVRLTDEERDELGRLPEGAPDTSTLIAEDREERWD